MTVDPKQLQGLLSRLDEATRKIVQTRGYGDDARILKMLMELLKEQDANTRRTTRTLR